ncbi:hypothetical protein B0A78_13535 [Flavobacterium columnare NBRC 100251 = ATCC 23463]|uniref:Uncharacterized protein n=2 Tax=Flavobacterium columnare TaxID=996 RepID=G8X6E7_FLACA|nr:hypothetical protein [Flavobacterium columnare]AEW86988.1 hypothetical protein FCOL_10925 [Flavobacterium columnare ATCC 49512]PDS21856.1 hypothetical protein B0A78_13535 [Flavobacterium columnare NBRC 100251 = ATCC 23463]OOB82118.1 hypothetical protein BZL53_12160 [Flavobacterium columnare]PTD14783.1 hypothetical protein C6N29_10220 [Flavobacterium columnare]GEM59307.1 hypothetical protein FC1_25450 [Flavobacterium columnare NBRC 100251 = ATCC 23463]
MIFSCSTKKGYQAIKYTGFSNTLKKNYTYKVSIKEGFEVKKIQGGNEWKQKEFVYSDNSILYISNEKGNTSRNYENIKNDEKLYDKAMLAFLTNDTITLEGIDKNNLYWKNKYNGIINIGYLNVPIEKKKEFDKAIISLLEK